MYYGGSWGLKDWALYYSNDKHSWLRAGTVSLEQVGESGKNYMYYSIGVESAYNFKAGDILYLKLVPVGKASLSSGNCDGFCVDGSPTGRIRFHSSITISPAEVATSSSPVGAALYEGFDSFNGGLDYFVGDRLAGMANFCGSPVSALSGFAVTNVYQRPGYAQIGYVDSQKQASDLKVTGGGTIDGATELTITDVPVDSWLTVTKTIVGATADTKVEFTSPEEGTFHRWFLDDICIK